MGNSLAVSASINIMDRAGEWRWALRLLKDCLLAARGSGGLSLLTSFSAAAASCGRSGCWDLALALFWKLHENRADPNSIMYIDALYAIRRSAVVHGWARALALQRQAGEQRHKPGMAAATAEALDPQGCQLAWMLPGLLVQACHVVDDAEASAVRLLSRRASAQRQPSTRRAGSSSSCRLQRFFAG